MNNAQNDSNAALKQVGVSEIKVQLKSIRNQVNKLLDILDVNVVPNATVVLNEGEYDIANSFVTIKFAEPNYRIYR